MIRRVLLSLVLALTCGLSVARAQGPGIVQPTFTPAELEKIFYTFPANIVGPRPTFADFQHGYLIIGSASETPTEIGGISFWDISNPRAPVLVENFQRSARKPHSWGFWEDYVLFDRLILDDVHDDPQIWNVRQRRVVSHLPPTLQRALITFVQAPYIYRGSSGYTAPVNRLSIWDVRNPLQPVLAREIDTSFLGFKPDSINVVGNLLLAAAGQGSGAAVFDVSDPLNPVLLSKNDPGDGRAIYQSQIYGSRFFTSRAQTGMRVYDFTDPRNLVSAATIPIAGNPRYVLFRDGIGWSPGRSGSLTKYSTDTFQILGTNSTIKKDFLSPLGNVMFFAGENTTAQLAAFQQQPDTAPPKVLFANPAPGATNVPLTSRIGFSMSDHISVTSLNSATIEVRKLGGGIVSGTYSTQLGIINFSPSTPLQPNSVYEITMLAGGVTDIMGNPVDQTFRMTIATGGTLSPPPEIQSFTSSMPAILAGGTTTFSVAATNPISGPLTYEWDFGDGATLPPGAQMQAAHSYSAPGRYTVIVRVSNGSSTALKTFVQVVHSALPSARPVASRSIVYDPARQKVWCVNPDGNTVSRIDGATPAFDLEAPVGKHPRGLALHPGASAHELWVACRGSDEIRILSASNGAAIHTIQLRYGAAPDSILFSPDGSAVYVSCLGSREVLRVDPLTRQIAATRALPGEPRALALTGDGQRLFVGRFRSSDLQGEVWELAAPALSITRTIPLARDQSSDSSTSGRGVPNYLLQFCLSPDERRLWVPAKKDNIERGQFLDGQPLTSENTVRSIVSQIDLAAGTEVAAVRNDVDNHELAHGIDFTPHGDLVFIAYQGNNEVLAFDALTNNLVGGGELGPGRAPQGMIISPDGRRLFTQNFLGRSISVFDIEALNRGQSGMSLIAEIPVVGQELFSPQVLTGKRVFYDASDHRMNLDGYISCATCHLDGGHDGRTWDFTNRGEGLRNTTSLEGRAGLAHGLMHWSANFDELQDFENDIRQEFGGAGFLSDADFAETQAPLGSPKAGRSADLDALAAYLSSLRELPRSPHRDFTGNLTSSAVSGRSIFQALQCTTCHTGDSMTDSSRVLALHDVGTLKPSTGHRLGQPLVGIDTPTLRGLWETAPYLHDGRAATLDDIFTEANAPAGSAHAPVRALNPAARQQLLDYLLQLDGVQRDSRSTKLEAESAVLSGSARISAIGSGHSGGGHVVTELTGGKITWSNVAAPVGAVLRICYAFGDPAVEEPLRFSAAELLAYGNQDLSGEYSVSANGETITLRGNRWRYLPVNYTVTAHTHLSFTLSSEDTGEFVVIGFDHDNSHTTGRGFFDLGGTDTYAGVFFDVNPTYVRNSGPRNYALPVGNFFQGAMQQFVFGVDDDVGPATAHAVFSNIRLYEKGAQRPLTVRVNGGAPMALKLDSTGGWDRWHEINIPVALNSAGPNTIELSSVQRMAAIDAISIVQEAVPALSPSTPGGIEIEAESGGRLRLTWEDGAASESTVIEMREAGSGAFIPLASVSARLGEWTTGTLLPGRTYEFRIAGRNVHADSAFSTLAAARTFTRFEDWKIGAGLSPTLPANADPERNGLPLLVEYSAGILPGDPLTAAAPVVTRAGNELHFTYRKVHAGELHYIIETSGDATDWTPRLDLPEQSLGDGLYRVAIPLPPGSSALFARLRVRE